MKENRKKPNDSENLSLLLVSLFSFTVFTSVFILAYSVKTSSTQQLAQADQGFSNKPKVKLADLSNKPLGKLNKDSDAKLGQSLFTSYEALEDPSDLIGKNFKVPKPLYYRTKFWYDIYTKWDSYNHVIHHIKFPWLVYEVVSTQKIYASNASIYTKNRKAKRLVAHKKRRIRNTLLKLSKLRSHKNLSPFESKLLKVSLQIPGSKRRVLRKASYSIRSQMGQRIFFKSALENSTKYIKKMETEFDKYKIPKELTRIPFVESSFNEKAVSKVGASGIWQIMPRTGKQFLTITKYIDERNSPLKATRSSALQLKRDFKILGRWPLAIMAYNHGVGSVRKAVRRLKTKNIGSIITHYKAPSFKFASKNFYSCFLAALHAEKYSEKLFKLNRKKPYDLVKIKLKSRIRIKKLVSAIGLSMKDFINFNLDLKKAVKKNLSLKKGFSIFIPRDLVKDFMAYFQKNKKNNHG